MKPLSAKVTHVYHSGFIIETPKNVLLFDYTDPGTENPTATRLHQLLQQHNTVVFVSHHHHDHFTPSLLDWQSRNPSLQIVAGFDVPLTPGNKTHLMKPHETLRINGVSIESFGSTDDGVSFYVRADNMSFFHAGDLNWWHWKSFSPAEQLKEEKEYKNALEKLRGKPIDIAFVPVDPRLDEHYYLAGEYFIETCKPSLFVPMHFGLNFGITRDFANKLSEAPSSVLVLSGLGQEFHFTKG